MDAAIDKLDQVIEEHLKEETRYVKELGLKITSLLADVDNLTTKNQQIVDAAIDIAKKLTEYDPSSNFDAILLAKQNAEGDESASGSESALLGSESSDMRPAPRPRPVPRPTTLDTMYKEAGRQDGGRRKTRRRKRHSFRRK